MKKLRERNGLLGVVRIRRGVEKIAMGVLTPIAMGVLTPIAIVEKIAMGILTPRFVEHRSGKSIAIDRYQNV